MPRVKKKSIEYGNRKRRKLAAAKRSIVYNPPLADGTHQNSLQMTGEMPPTPPLTSPDSDDFKTDHDLKSQNPLIIKLKNPDLKYLSSNTSGIKEEKIETSESVRPIKGLSELISESIISAKDAAIAVSAVTSKASLKKPEVLTSCKEKQKTKSPKLMKETNIKVTVRKSMPSLIPKASLPTATTGNPGKVMVNLKGFGNTTPSGGNTQKAYALYVGGQLKYILPYNGPLGTVNSIQQPNNEMKKLICRGVNGKTEIALAKPTVVCDEEKKKIVFVVQKKATTSPGNSLLSNNNQASTGKVMKIPSISTLSTTSGQSLQGNHIISDNMLKLLLPAVSASINNNTPISLPPQVSLNGKDQTTISASQPDPPKRSATPVTNASPKSSLPIVVKIEGNANKSISTTTPPPPPTTTTTNTITLTAISSTTTTTTTTTTPSSSPTLICSSSGSPTSITPTTSISTSPTTSVSSIRPVQLFTRDSARKLCPVLNSENKHSITIVDPAKLRTKIFPGKSLLGKSELPSSDAKKPSKDSAVLMQLKQSSKGSPLIPAHDKDEGLTGSDDTPLRINSPKAEPASLSSTCKAESMASISSCEETDANDEDDGMFGLKISSVFSLADNPPCSAASEDSFNQENESDSTEPFLQDPIPGDTLATAMKLAVGSDESKLSEASDNADDVRDTLETGQRTVILNLSTDNLSSQLSQDKLQVTFDNPESQNKSSENNSIAKSLTSAEQQTLATLDFDEDSLFSEKLSEDPETNHSQKENASPKRGIPIIACDKDFFAGQNYITVDIFRHNGQTKITAISSTGKKEPTKPVQSNGDSDTGSGSSSSSSVESKPMTIGSDPRLNEVFQCAAYSLPKGTYFFIPLTEKVIAVPSQKRKKNRSAYIFERHHNYMQVKMAKYMVLNSKDKLPASLVTSANGSQVICQISATSKGNEEEEEPSLPGPSLLPVKDTVPTLEAPPIVTGKRIRRPKIHTGFEDNMDLILPPLRKCRKKLKPIIKMEKGTKEETHDEKSSIFVDTKFDNKNIGVGFNDKLLLKPVEPKVERSAVLCSMDMPKASSQNTSSSSYVIVHPPTVSHAKSMASVSTAEEPSFQDSNPTSLQIDSIQSLQTGGIKIKSEPITSGYGDEPPKPPSPMLSPAPSLVPPVQVGHDALGMPYTIKKEPNWYGYEQDPSSVYPMATAISTDQSNCIDTTNITLKTDNTSKLTYCPETEIPSLYKMDRPTKPPTGKKRGRKRKESTEIKPEIKKRKYVRHKTKTETSVSASSSSSSSQTSTSLESSMLNDTIPSYSLKTEIKTEPLEEPVSISSPHQSGETPQEERIRRLKEILREKEQKLEEIRLNLSVTSTI